MVLEIFSKLFKNISILDHFLFIVPMNKKKMIDPTNKSNPDESIIEKYLTLPFFTSEQSYFRVLKTMGFDENISILFNDFLTTPHLNTKALTAREL